MKRKKSEIPTKIFTYGAFAPIENVELVEEQYKYAHLYMNKLIEIERRRRQKYRELLQKSSEEARNLVVKMADISSKINGLYEIVRADRIKNRSRREDHVLAIEIRRLKDERSDYAEKLREIGKKLKDSSETFRAALKQLDEEANDEVKKARASSNLYWGTYNLIEKSMEQVRKSKNEPRFRKWDEAPARLGVQIQKTAGKVGMTVDQLFSGVDPRIQVRAVPEEAWMMPRGERRRQTRTEVKLRIGSDGRKPVWATFPMALHRPLPKDSVIKLAWIHRIKIAHQWVYRFQISAESKSFVRPNRIDSGAIGIDIGWRRRAGLSVMRMAFGADEEGRSYDVHLPPDHTDKLAHVDSLEAIRGRHFKEVMDYLKEWLATNPALPDWWIAKAPHITSWRSSVRLEKFVWYWRSRRFAADADVFGFLDTWRKKERHLHEWSDNERDKTLARRKEYYRVLAATLARRYSHLVIEKFNLRKMARAPELEEGESWMSEKARFSRFRAAPNEFRQALRAAASKYGSQIIEVPAERTTLMCHLCGHDVPWDTSAPVEHKCEGCGAKWDQDHNAAINILRRWKPKSSGSVAMKQKVALEVRDSQ